MDHLYKFSTLQRKRTTLPVGTFLFILAVFVIAHPFEISNSGFNFSRQEINVDDTIEKIETGGIRRPIALFSLGVFAVMTLLYRKRNRLRVNKLLGWLIFFYLLWAISSILWSDSIWLTVRRVMILVLLSIGALAIAERLSLRETAALVLFICTITLLTSIVAERAANTFLPFESSWRFSGVIHPIHQGWNCSLLAITTLVFYKSTDRRRAVYIGISLVALLFLLLTKSRMAFAATVVGAGVYWSLVLPKSYKVAFVFSLVILVCLMALTLEDKILTYVREAVTLGRGLEGKASVSTLTGRIPLWNECLCYWAKRPLLGYGYNAFLNPHRLRTISHEIGWVPGSLHSGYIETLLGLGSVGAGTLVLILLLALKNSISLSKRNSEYAFVVAVLVWLCCNLVLEADLITKPTFPTFLCMILLAKLGFVQTPMFEITLRHVEDCAFRSTGVSGRQVINVADYDKTN